MKARTALWAGVLAALLASASPVHCSEDRKPGATAQGAALDAAIRGVLAQPRFEWRSPRPPQAENEDSMPLQFLKGVDAWLADAVDAVRIGIGSALSWIFRKIESLLRRLPFHFGPSQDPSLSSPDLGEAPVWFAFGLLALVASLFAILLRRRLRRAEPSAGAAPLPALPVDLNQPRLSGAELPEQGWLDLAVAMAARGEHRLALRAYYLAGLSTLGRTRMLALSPGRSVGDYRRQLRKAAARIQDIFGPFSALYERCWFGLGQAGGEECEQARLWQEGLRDAAP